MVDQSIYSTLFISLVLFICIVLYAFVLIHRVHKPLNKLIGFVQNAANRSDYLQSNIELENEDEYKSFANAFNAMNKKIVQYITKIKEQQSELTLLNQELEKRVEDRTKQLAQKSKKVSTLLDNSGEGFLSFGKELLIFDEFSKECEKIIGTNFVGKNILDVLYINYEEKKVFFAQTLKDALEQEEPVVAKSFLQLMPKEVLLDKKTIKIEYKIIEKDVLMLILSDITTKKALELKIKREQEFLKMIVAIVGDSSLFFDTKDEFTYFMQKIDLIEKRKNSLKEISEVYRDVHTFKGVFSQFFMQNIVEYLHQLETKITNLIKGKALNYTLSSVLNKEEINAYFERDLDVVRNILGQKYFEEKKILKINEDSIIDLENKISSYCSIDKANQHICEAILKDTHKLRNKPILELFSSFPKVCMDLALKLDKLIYPFEIMADKSITVPEEYKPFIKSLIHVFRNMIDHGIEDIETRLEANKYDSGTIVCNIGIENGYLTIIISDDGGGIDIDEIRKKAVSKEIITEEEVKNLSNKKVLELIFHDSFSTKDEVSEISGRGVGLSAVKYEIEKIDGTIEINSTLGEGTTFIFKIPYIN